MTKQDLNKYPRLFGLIGYPLSHSFSKKYFTHKFQEQGLKDHYYELFPLKKIEELRALLAKFPNLRGLNVTIPYKEAVLSFLDEIDESARSVGAVNTIQIKDGSLKGFNTDVYGFEKSLKDFTSLSTSQSAEEKSKFQTPIKKALILGTGGAAKAVCYVLKKQNIEFLKVSRAPEKGDIIYRNLNDLDWYDYQLIVNTTPLGMSPNQDTCPEIPYEKLGSNHLLFDLVYNPEKTLFLAQGEEQNCSIINGLSMLHLQAEKAWEIWNTDNEKHEEMTKPSATKPVKDIRSIVDFSNTEIAFSDKSDKELKKTAWLFSMMNKPWMVNSMSNLGLLALKLRLPFVQTLIKSTIFEQFVGGTTLLESQKTIDRLYGSGVLSILDYGAEGKNSETDFNITMTECIRAIEFAATNESVPVISTKITGLVRDELLEKIQKGGTLDEKLEKEYSSVLKRIDSICHVANQHDVGIFFDAEESWMQDGIDNIVEEMMKRYNKEKVIVYNTFQMYRHDRLDYLMKSYDKSQKEGYLLGAKLVRGAYMEKERKRAEEMNYPSPIHPNKEATDHAYNMAVRFCVDHYETIGSTNATHNMESCMLQADLIHQKGIPKNHKHLNFCQLLGMSDHITFNLAKAGYNVAKYLPYGSVKEVTPYLIRRAQENTSVTGDMSREYQLVAKELKRRGL